MLSIVPNLCLLFSMYCAYADCGLLTNTEHRTYRPTQTDRSE